MTRGSFVFNGFSSLGAGLRVGGVASYAASGREVQAYYVPGRIGAVYPASDYSQIPNEIREYTVGLYRRADPNEAITNVMALLRDTFLNVDGYAILTDSYEPQFYRRAFFAGDFVPTRKGAGQNFEIPLRFSCDPRRYIAGDYDFTIYGSSGTVTYDTPSQVGDFYITEPSKPLIKVSTGGDACTILFKDAETNATFGQLKLAGLHIDTDFMFDAETLMAWFPDTGDNASMLIEDVIGEIRLGPGSTRISFDDPLVALKFTPRWWVR